jgi:hypothetical protein
VFELRPFDGAQGRPEQRRGAAAAACRLRAKRFGAPRRSLGGGGAERAAHLVDHVLPDVPIRQWVLSLPHRLRYVLAWDPDLCRAVAGILARAVFRLLRERARDAGIEGGRGGGVIVIRST